MDRRSARVDRESKTVDLCFHAAEDLEHVEASIERDISAIVSIGRTLFCACDETSTVERLTFDEQNGRFGGHRSIALGDFFELPDGPDGEMDIEGMAVDAGYLWVTGSHGLKRDDPDDDAEDLYGMLDLDYDRNRGFLGRIPLVERSAGSYELIRRIEPLDGPSREAASLKLSGGGKSVLRKLLKKDPLIAPFLPVPCKENGFDVEGLAVAGERILLGLRGPVIGGFAILVELRLKLTKRGFLKPGKLDNGKRYRLIAVPLDGLGIRELLYDDGRLLVLAGATTDIEAGQGIYVIDCTDEPLPAIVAHDRISRIVGLPFLQGSDHAEGMTLLSVDGQRYAAIAFDSPQEARVDTDTHTLKLDLFEI